MESFEHHQDPVSLLARESVALSLAAFLRDPSIYSPRAGEVSGFRAAWEHFDHLVESVTGRGLADGLDCGVILGWLEEPPARRLMVHHGVFGLLVSGSCPPYETEYVPSDQANHRAHVLADITGFYHAFGLQPHPAHPERADHAALELEFMAFLLEKMRRSLEETEHFEVCASALARFFEQHLLWWLPAFAKSLEARVEKMASLAPDDLEELAAHAILPRLLRGWLEAEMGLMGVSAPQRPVGLPVREVVAALPESCAGCLGSAEEFTCGRGGAE